jgi:hypothetical protein
MVPPFRNAIISSDDKKEVKTMKSSFNNNFYDDNLLHQLQKMYTFLTFSEKQAYNPKDFCSSFKDMIYMSMRVFVFMKKMKKAIYEVREEKVLYFCIEQVAI